MATYNVYCDESCHLEHDPSPVMVIGATWCLKDDVPSICRRVNDIKEKHGLGRHWECKWTKVSPAKVELYRELVDEFFEHNQLRFRGILVANKTNLNHAAWSQTHDDWYYKMFFRMLTVITDPANQYRIYIDIKDTNASRKASRLREVLCNAKYDFPRQMIDWIQPVRSHECVPLQLADLLIGAIAYCNRDLESSQAKLAVVKRIQERSGLSLRRSTLYGARKFNLFRWEPGDTV
jgi:hypothetical protein